MEPTYLTPSEVAAAMVVAMQADTPLMIHGLPGIGKTALYTQLITLAPSSQCAS